MIFCASSIYAQTTADFSGVWVLDTLKSDDFYKAFDVKCTITQTPKLITIVKTFSDKSGNEMASHNNEYNLDGKEVSKQGENGINKDIATWSADKKTLDTKSTVTNGSDEYGFTATYSLSNNSRVLTIESADINPFGLKLKLVFNKKQ